MLIRYECRNQPVRVDQQHELACCAINVVQVYAGMPERDTEKTETLLRSLEYIPIRFPMSPGEHISI
jgi:hypothetical protein